MPKTVRNIYENAVSFENLLLAHKKARCGKREKNKVILVELVLEQELLRLEKELKNCTYKHSSYTTFKVYQPKERIIMASEYIDRIVHQWYVQHFIKPYFVPQFINTTTKKETVKPETIYYYITTTANEGGSISPNEAKVEKGQQQTFKINPDKEYEIQDVIVDGTSVGAVTEYTFENVDKNETIQAVFKKKEIEESNNAENNIDDKIDGKLPKLGSENNLWIVILICGIIGINSLIKLIKLKNRRN